MKALTALALVAVLGLGVVVCLQQREINALKTQVGSTSSPMESRSEQQKKAEAGTVVAEKLVTIDGSPIAIQYRCSGEIKKGVERVGDPAEEISFCVGDFELVAMIRDQSIIITSGHAVSGVDSPVLLKAVAVGDQGNVLISYKPYCASTGDCGAGLPMNEVTHVLRAKDASVQTISHFPPSGIPVWNSLFTKALFIPETCGGAGCDLAPIIAYDLVSDSSKDITKEKAVGLGKDAKTADATDPVGDRLPVWRSIEWLTGDAFTAVMLKSDGSQQKVMGTF